MSESFDPYHRWLGISSKEQPPNLYRLLGLELLESDPEVIRDAAEQRMAHVRTYQLGPRAALSQKILNELAAAKSCLLDAERKTAYDAELGAKLGRREAPSAKARWWLAAAGAALVAGLALIVVARRPTGEPPGGAPEGSGPVGPPAERPLSAPSAADVAMAKEAPPAAALPAPARADETEPVFVELVDRRGLTGWHTLPRGRKGFWAVENGEIVSHAGPGPSLFTDRHFHDFELQMEFLLGPEANTAVIFHGGYRLILLDLAPDRRAKSVARCGAIWHEVAPRENAYKGPNLWNTLALKFIGRRVTVVMNGTSIVDHILGDTQRVKPKIARGLPMPIGLLRGQGGGELRFRNIRIRDIAGSQSGS